MRVVFVTGVAGFIGAALAQRLLRDGVAVVGIDNLNDYYDPALKAARVEETRRVAGDVGGSFRFETISLEDGSALETLMREVAPETVVHLAAQASVRYGLKNPRAYLNRNLVGHFEVLEACRAVRAANPAAVVHLLYASSSSVYGNQEKVPFSETDDVSRPVSLYAATKRADELVTHAYARQFNLPATGMRFFTVYGPWGRPDMSPVLFASAMLNGESFPLFNHGDLWRDFTYIDDIVEAIVRLMPLVPQAGDGNGGSPHEIYNLGNQNPVKMVDFVTTLAGALGVDAKPDMQEWPVTEVYKTFADTAKLQAAVGWAPFTPLKDGLGRFADWYKGMHGRFAV